MLNQLVSEDIARRFGIDPDNEFYECLGREMLEHESKWHQAGLVWAWIDPKPEWVSARERDPAGDFEPKEPCTLRYRLELIGGGEIRVVEKWEESRWEGSSERFPDIPPMMISYSPHKLRVTADVGDGLRRYPGELKHVCLEMVSDAVIFPRGTPQAVADRAAATFCLIDRQIENFQALLSHRERCGCCDRPLRDQVSKVLGIGPDCARKLGLPHSVSIADRVLQRRRELLGEVAEARSDKTAVAA